MIKCFIIENQPSNKAEWNKLCQENSNFLQSTYFDSVQYYFNEIPIYFEVRLNDQLIGGVKLYFWQSRRIKIILSKLSKTISQNSEFLVTDHYPQMEIIKFLNDEIDWFINKKEIVSFQGTSFYGNPHLIFKSSKKYFKTNKIGIGFLNLNRSLDDIVKAFHGKHRNSLNKSQKSELYFSESTNSADIIELMKFTYSNQQTSPNFGFVQHAIETILETGKGKIFVIRDGKQNLISSAFIQIFGKKADYTFGGNVPNNHGAGQLLQFQIIKELKKLNIEVYSLGQISIDKEILNEKFVIGITRFKLRFGAEILDGKSELYILKPFYYFLFKWLKKRFI